MNKVMKENNHTGHREKVIEKISLNKAVEFHGHLGPYLILGLLAGEIAVKRLKCKKYFGLTIKVCGVNEKPRSCLIDGLQLSTGATYGKGNITKLKGTNIKIVIHNLENNKKAVITLLDDLTMQLEETKTHIDSERLARKIYKTDCSKLFKLQ